MMTTGNHKTDGTTSKNARTVPTKGDATASFLHYRPKARFATATCGIVFFLMLLGVMETRLDLQSHFTYVQSKYGAMGNTTYNNDSLPVLMTTSRASNTTTIKATRISSSSSSFYDSPKPFRGSTKRILVIPEHKLVFCYVEKVGCSMFNHLFRMVRLYHPSMKNRTMYEKNFLAKDTWYRLHLDVYNMTYQDYLKILKDPTWTKAMFYRDPAIRFLSAFRSKCGRVDVDGAFHCTRYFGKDIETGNATDFRKAVARMTKNYRRVFKNPHYAPQSYFCGGLNRSILEHYDIVEKLNPKTSPAVIANLLNHVGVDHNTTHKLIETVVKTGGARNQQLNADIRKRLDVQLRWAPTNRQKHDTRAGASNALSDFFQNDEILRQVQQLYRMDYDLFNITALPLQNLSSSS